MKQLNDNKDTKDGLQTEKETKEAIFPVPKVARRGANVFVNRLVNTCTSTIDNGLTILHLKECENENVKK